MVRLCERRARWAVAGITLGAFALYAFRLTAPSLTGDEAFTAVFSQWSLREILRALRSTEPHPPLYYLLMHAWIALLGQSELALRFPSFIPGVLLVPLTYVLSRQGGQACAGIWAAALVAVNPFLLWHGQNARMYSLLAALGLGSLLFAIRLLKLSFNPSMPLLRIRFLRTWLGYFTCTLAALATHYFGALLLFAQNIAWAVIFAVSKRDDRLSRHRHFAQAWLSAQTALALAFGPWLFYAGGFVLGHRKDWIVSVGPFAFAKRLLTTFSLGTTVTGIRVWPWLGAFGLLCALGLYTSWRRDRRRALIATTVLWAGLIIPVAITFAISLFRPAFDERYLISCVPIYLLFVARGMFWLQERWYNAPAAILIFLALASGYAIHQYHFQPRYAKSPDWRGLADYVARHQEPGDILILNYPDPALEYYNAGRFPYALLPSAFPVDPGITAETLAQLSKAHPRIWLVPTRAENWDRDGLVEHWLDRHADVIAEERFQGLHLRLYHTPQRYAQTMRPVHAILGAVARLEGYDLWLGEKPIPLGGSIPTGATLRLKLYWRPLAPMERDYTVFTHLVDAQGTIRGQKDSPPLAGVYPTSKWQPGEQLVDCYDIPVQSDAPPSVYRLLVGMYIWPSLERLLVTDALGNPMGDYVPLAELRVGL